MPETRSAVPPKRGAVWTKQAPASTPSTHEIRLRSQDGTKRTYDILQESQDSKNGFLTLVLRSDTYKARYKASAERYRWPGLEEGVECGRDHSEGKVAKPADIQQGQPSEQSFVSKAYQETLKDLNLVEPNHGDVAVPPGKYAQQTEAQASPDKHASPEVTLGLQQASATLRTHQPGIVEEPGSQSGLDRGLPSADPEVAKKEVEGLLSPVNQSLDTASKSAPDSFLKEWTAKQLSQAPTSGLSKSIHESLATEDPVSHLAVTQADFEGKDSITKRLHEPLRIDTSQPVNTSAFLLQTNEQNQHRGLKRSRTPEPPSLTSGAPSAPETPLSSRSSRRTSPAKPRGRPRKAAVPSSFALPQKIVTFITEKLPQGWFLDPDTMAPVRDPSDVSNKIKDVIQNLYDVQSQTHGFVPETQSLLIDKMAELTQSLSALQRLTDRNISPNNPVHDIDLAPEIVDYVDDGRNPDIFTRDFVELVQRGNAVVNGKKQAFRDFSQVYARALKEGIGGVEGGVDLVMENAGIEQEMGREQHGGKENGEKG